MHSFSLLSFAASALLAASATAQYVQFNNMCDQTIYWETHTGEYDTLVDSGSVDANSSTQLQYPTTVGENISLKHAFISPVEQNNPYQLEYVNADGSQVNYDLSAINGDPFIADMRTVIPSDTTCTDIVCNPNDDSCAYPNGNPNYYCSLQAILTYTICGT